MKLTLNEVVMPLNPAQQTIYKYEDGHVIAYAKYIEYEDDTWLLTDIFVAGLHRGKGYGSKLLDEFMTVASAFDKTVVLLAAANEYAPLQMEELIAWYRRHGFKEHASWFTRGHVLVSI